MTATYETYKRMEAANTSGSIVMSSAAHVTLGLALLAASASSTVPTAPMRHVPTELRLASSTQVVSAVITTDGPEVAVMEELKRIVDLLAQPKALDADVQELLYQRLPSLYL
jgi:hypothetical protein